MSLKSYPQKVNISDTIEHGIGRVLVQGKTQYQEYMFFESDVHGVCIALDGDIQSCESDEVMYHEALVHPAMLAHKNPKTVLIMGGGEGATAREVLSHKSVQKVVMVDLDKEFVELCKTYIKSWGESAFKDERLEIFYMDINEYLAQTQEKFDVVIGDLIDVSDWESEIASLYSTQMYEKVKKVLTPSGIVATQAGALDTRTSTNHKKIREMLGRVFNDVHSYGIVIPSFYHLWGYLIAGDDLRVIEESLAEKFRQSSCELEFKGLGVESLISAFSLPMKIENTFK